MGFHGILSGVDHSSPKSHFHLMVPDKISMDLKGISTRRDPQMWNYREISRDSEGPMAKYF